MKRWQEPELKDLSLKATKDGQPECPYAPENADEKCIIIKPLPKEVCCHCPYVSGCFWPWKYKGSCDVIS